LDQISIATIGDSESLQVGEPAIAIGNALGYGQSVTTGVISAVDRPIDMDGSTNEFIQTDAAINPGNSGGALLNISGEVIGINSNKIVESTIEGMGYAIPISSALPIIENLMSKETLEKVAANEAGYLGITGVNVTTEWAEMYSMPEGVYITRIYEGSPAEQYGLKKGDVIISFDGTEVSSMEELIELMAYYSEGTSVNVKVMRLNQMDYAEETVTVVLGSKAEVSQ
jgi:serine protease Do